METTPEKFDEGFLTRYFNFKSLVSLWLIKVLYAVGLIVITIGSIIQMFSSQFLIGLGGLVLGNLLWRVVCEGLVIGFRIAGSLSNIEKNTAK